MDLGCRVFIPTSGAASVAFASQRSLEMNRWVTVDADEDYNPDTPGFWVIKPSPLSSDDIRRLRFIVIRLSPVALWMSGIIQRLWDKYAQLELLSANPERPSSPGSLIPRPWFFTKHIRFLEWPKKYTQFLEWRETPDSTKSPVVEYKGRRWADICQWQIHSNRFLWHGRPETFLQVTKRGRLGQGSIGEVYEVEASQRRQVPTMARKSILISRRKRLASRELHLIKEEIANMRLLEHAHIVSVLGCYQEGEGTKQHHFHVLMFPVGDEDLGTFLEDSYDSSEGSPHPKWVEAWFSCLASALAYMHLRNVHHEDIKPKNIIHQGSNILFTDFSSSRKFESGQETSTANPARASRLFAAPEALPTGEGNVLRHGSKTDIFSLGLVFMEMLTILSGEQIDELHDAIHVCYPDFDDNWENRQYHRVVDFFESWFASTSVSSLYEICVRPMLLKDRRERPSADAVLKLLHTQLPACQCIEEPTSLLGAGYYTYSNDNYGYSYTGTESVSSRSRSRSRSRMDAGTAERYREGQRQRNPYAYSTRSYSPPDPAPDPRYFPETNYFPPPPTHPLDSTSYPPYTYSTRSYSPPDPAPDLWYFPESNYFPPPPTYPPYNSYNPADYPPPTARY